MLFFGRIPFFQDGKSLVEVAGFKFRPGVVSPTTPGVVLFRAGTTVAWNFGRIVRVRAFKFARNGLLRVNSSP